MKATYTIVFGSPQEIIPRVNDLLERGWELVGPAMPDSANLGTHQSIRVVQTLVKKNEKTT